MASKPFALPNISTDTIVIDVESERYTWFPNMNLITPNGQEDVWCKWLLSGGYQGWKDLSNSEPHPSLKTVAITHREGRMMQIGTDDVSELVYRPIPIAHLEQRVVAISVTQSRSGVIPVLLGSTYTAQMNAISSTRIYCMFPNLVMSPLSLQSDRSRPVQPVRNDTSHSPQNSEDS
jgi:hypothetical protein